jgi:galactonate dehydratase
MNRRELLGGAVACASLASMPATGAEASLKAIRIRRATLYIVNVPETKWWWSDDVYGQPAHQREDHHLVEVETDQGITGLTEVFRTPLPAIREGLQAWLGKDVLKVNPAVDATPLKAAFEQAVLDIRGQALGVPIWQLLGGRVRDRILVTQCTGYKTPQHTAEQAAWGWEHGFRVYKMKCITTEDTAEKRIRYVTDRVEAIHKILPDMLVRPDVRWRLQEVWVVQELARRLQGRRVECIESPITNPGPQVYSEWRRLRHTIALPIAEHVSASQLPGMFQAEALDYAIVGSASHLETLQASHLAHRLGMGGWSQTVAYGPGAAMGLHVAACMPHLTKAYDMVGPMVWEETLVNEPFVFEGGSFLVPDRPGLGYTLNRSAVKKYQVSREEFAGPGRNA